MKACFAIILLVGIATALPQQPGAAPFAAAPAAPAAPAQVAAPAFQRGIVGNPFGPKAFGPGLNNPNTFPPNPLMIQRAQQIVSTIPGSLMRVDVDGSVSLVDEFGRDLEDSLGFDLD